MSVANPWEPERVVDRALAARLVAAQFSALAGAPIEPLGVGWDNTVFRIDGRWVFRFPRRSIAVGLIEIEARVLPTLAPHLPLAIPVPTLLGQPTDEFPWPFAGYPYLPGRTACAADLTASQRQAAAPSLAAFLRALHDLDHAAHGTPGDVLGRLDTKKRLPRLCDRLDQLAARGVINDALSLKRCATELATNPIAMPPLRVVHGDLYARHILVDAAGAPSGIIDWGDVHAGGIANDLMIAYGFLPPTARAAFFATYGAVDESTHRLARFKALFHGAAIALYGDIESEVALRREGELALRHALAP